MYYSLFYGFRSLLCLNGFCTFHVGDSHYMVSSNPAASPESCPDRGDHKAVSNSCMRAFPSHHLLSQLIDLQPPFNWFAKLREQVNYQKQRFVEPGCSDEFAQVQRFGLRRAINAYLRDDNDTYTFDSDHAVIAYPLRALRLIGQELAKFGITSTTSEEASFLRLKSRDRAGDLAALQDEMRKAGLIS